MFKNRFITLIGNWLGWIRKYALTTNAYKNPSLFLHCVLFGISIDFRLSTHALDTCSRSHRRYSKNEACQLRFLYRYAEGGNFFGSWRTSEKTPVFAKNAAHCMSFYVCVCADSAKNRFTIHIGILQGRIRTYSITMNAYNNPSLSLHSVLFRSSIEVR